VVALKRVLIVEDEPIVAACLEAELSTAGFEVCGVASSEEEALRLANACAPDLAVVDVRLAPGDGRAVTRNLADQFRTKVLLVTAEDPDQLQGAGAQGVLPKPYDIDDVVPAINAVEKLAQGETPDPLPDHMKKLRRD
jgi:DNA-binding NarL/FixJ family response regulator